MRKREVSGRGAVGVTGGGGGRGRVRGVGSGPCRRGMREGGVVLWQQVTGWSRQARQGSKGRNGRNRKLALAHHDGAGLREDTETGRTE